jgi:hypothetical protein
MFTAYNVRTQKIVNSLMVFNDPTYELPDEDEWLADPEVLQNVAKNYEEIIQNFPQGVEVRYRQKSIKTSQLGHNFVVSPHFYIPNAKKKGIELVPYTKEHNYAQNWLFNVLHEKKVSVFYSWVKSNGRLEKIGSRMLTDLPIDWNKAGIEVGIKLDNRRVADVYLPFFKTQKDLGNGIVFEIQFSRQKKVTEEKRTDDWAVRGFSVCWLFKPDFVGWETGDIKLVNNDVHIDGVWINELYKIGHATIKNIKILSREKSEVLDKKYDETVSMFAKIIHQGKKIIQGEVVKGKYQLEPLIQKSVDRYGVENLDPKLFSITSAINLKINEEVKSQVETGIIQRYVGKFETLESSFETLYKNINQDLQGLQEYCELCGAKMIIRKRKDGSGFFWTCPNFPRCQSKAKNLSPKALWVMLQSEKREMFDGSKNKVY